MGKAKEKGKRLQQFIEQHPCCCFCGGTTPTESIDHVPSKQIFRLKHRPKGLEFPACKKCNEISAPHELVAALIARASLSNSMNKDEKKELQKLFRAVDKNRHGLLNEMRPDWRQQYDFNELDHPDKPVGRVVFNAQSPMLNYSMQLFGAKLCLALHYEHKKVIVPKSGGVSIRWLSNWDRITNNMPDELLAVFQVRETLKAGKWNVKDQFEYSYLIPKNSEISAFFCTFGESFAIVGYIQLDTENPQIIEGTFHKPGQIYEL